MNPPRSRPRPDEQGQVTVLIVGFAIVLVLALGVVVDASAAYLQRQGLDTLADGAALAGTRLEGHDAYEQGLDGATVELDLATAEAAVEEYLTAVGAYDDFNALDWRVSVAGDTVVVDLSAELELPFTVSGVTDARIRSTGASSLVLPG